MNHRTSCSPYSLLFFLILIAILGNAQTAAPTASKFTPQEGEYILKDVHFESGETLPELHMHYMTLGKPVQDSSGRVTNAVLLLHGTGGSGRQFLAPQFANELFGPGQLLDMVKSKATPTLAIATTSFCLTMWDMESRASRVMGCMRAFRNTTMTTWCARNMICSHRDWVLIICG